MRIMGLDVGEKRIGVAVSDPLGWTAQGIGVIRRDQPRAQIMEQLKKLVREYRVERIVVGLPRNMNGTLGKQGQRVLDFAREIGAELELPVETWDERLSTASAEKVLLSADLSRARRRKIIDKMAAVIILQSYLDSRFRS
ncbi:Holliday junction resolvase RuvX [Desulfofundulus thermocisternus]|uniref:Holliday junction resolvase RuvX n=1 Tax=Desulfofundulus thermocisternus TaxID=42471 RepID=UPI001A0117F5|nr:Holliday junction resolvase RuvX [Desulfofundulus thermocisternus]MBE3584749.1 Holliday junction resolvase RuvX [Thermoanaerobacter sp.]MCS5694848.1 Holliday junction resolvase RuvX [Desulfofundulus thermocisternus]